MRRKPGSLLPLEIAICVCAARLRRRGTESFHGYAIAQELSDELEHPHLTAYGTLYRALGRLVDMGLLADRWEDPQVALDAGRPPRRLYTLTAAGQVAAGAVRSRQPVKSAAGSRRRLAPT